MQWGSALVVSIAMFACADDESASRKTCGTSEALIGGELDDDSSFDAVGFLTQSETPGVADIRCTGTLVAPDVVVTAKHCVQLDQDITVLDQGSLFFAVGANLAQLRHVVPVRAVTLALPDSGGYTTLGLDLAVLRLEHPILDVAPIALSTEDLTVSDVGEELETHGYGASTSKQARARLVSGSRRFGSQTLRLLTGNVFKFIYGDLATFRSAVQKQRLLGAATTRCEGGRADSALDAEHIERVYRSGKLLADGEAWLSSTHSQVCYGDSGGPLLRKRGEARELIGVASWSWRSEDSPCAGGTSFALLSSDVREQLMQEAPELLESD